MDEQRYDWRGLPYEPREYKVKDPQGRFYARHPSLEECMRAADHLGTGAVVEGLDQDLNPTGDIVYTVE